MNQYFTFKSFYFRFFGYSFLILIFLIIYFFHLFPASFFSANHIPDDVKAYDDQRLNGNSTASISFDKEGMHTKFHVGGNYIYPYTGVSFQTLPFSLEECSQIELVINCPENMNLLLIFSELDKSKVDSAFVSKQFCQYVIECKKGEHIYHVPLTNFSIPLWWLREEQITNTPAIRWENLNAFFIQNDPILLAGAEQSFILKEIQFNKPLKTFLYLAGFIALLGLLLEIYLHKTREVVIKYVPILPSKTEVANPWILITDYLAKHYAEEIALESIALATGLGKQKITVLMKENSGLNLRQYINTIRIQEAERLMKETSLSISEIGYEVGYSSATHFNRVFKELKGCSPSEYRKQKTLLIS